MKVTVIPIVIGALGAIPKRIGKGTRRLGNNQTSEDHPNYSIINIDQNAEKTWGDLLSLKLQWKTIS